MIDIWDARVWGSLVALVVLIVSAVFWKSLLEYSTYFVLIPLVLLVFYKYWPKGFNIFFLIFFVGAATLTMSSSALSQQKLATFLAVGVPMILVLGVMFRFEDNYQVQYASMILYMAITLLLVVLNPGMFSEDTYKDVNAKIVFALAIFSVLLLGLAQLQKWTNPVNRIGIIVVASCVLAYVIRYAMQFIFSVGSASPWVIYGIIALVAAGVVLMVPWKFLFSYMGRANYVVRYLDVLWCRLWDLFGVAWAAVRAESLVTWVAAALTLVVAVLYFKWTAIEKKAIEGLRGHLIFNEPLKLNKAHSFKLKHFKYNYAISCWLNLEPSPPDQRPSATVFTPVLSYGGKPAVLYNASTNVLRLSMTDTDNHDILMADISVPLQTWVHFVFVCNKGAFDLFMNGELIKTVPIVPNPNNTTLEVGQAAGVKGSICNTMIFWGSMSENDQLVDPISGHKILEIYNKFKGGSPPVF